MALGDGAPRRAGSGQADRRRTAWSTLTGVAFGLATLVAIVVNLMPLQIVGSFDMGVTELIAGLGLRLDDSISVSLVQRLVVYVPLGLLAYAMIALRGGRYAFLVTVLIIAAVGMAVELLQGFLSKRQAFSIDFLLVLIVGALTALAGEIAAGLLARRRIALLQLLLLGNVLVLSATWLAHRGSELASWDCGYPLIIGNETTSDRPWLGKLRGLAVYPKALADEQVASLNAGFGAEASIDRRELGARLLRSFGQRHELEILRPALIEATRDASGLCEAIKSAEAFTIEIEFASLDLDQHGPARILSMSEGPEKRNVTIGQDGTRLLLRIRNELNGENGIERQIRTAKNVVTGSWQHWVARYDRGVTMLFLDGEALKPSLDYEALLLVSGRTSLPLAAISGVISMILGAAAYGWLNGTPKSAWRRMASAAVIAMAPQAAVALTIVVTSHRLLPLSVSLAIGLATAIGVVVGWVAGRARLTSLAEKSI